MRPGFDEFRVEREVQEAVERICTWLSIPAHRARIRTEMRRDPYLVERIRQAFGLLALVATELETLAENDRDA